MEEDLCELCQEYAPHDDPGEAVATLRGEDLLGLVGKRTARVCEVCAEECEHPIHSDDPPQEVSWDHE